MITPIHEVEKQRIAYQVGWHAGVAGANSSPREPSTVDAYVLGHADGRAACAMMMREMLRLYPRAEESR